jgi:hypothetical protein
LPRPPRLSLALKSILAASDVLARLPDSPELIALKATAAKLQAEAETWPEKPPTYEEREAMMKKVLGLHVAVTKLARTSTP